MRKQLLALTFGLLLPVLAWSQVTVSGKITDSADGSALPGANVSLEGTGLGNSSSIDGTYTIRNVRPGTYTIKATFIGYREQKKEIVVARAPLTVNFSLEEAFIETQGLDVVADRARERETPVAFSDIPKVKIESQLASRDIPLLLNTLPSMYATNAGGGEGDSRINTRGFDQRNTAVMINGVPVNDMENGWVYWSNWDGIGDVTSSIQVQRGLGASMLAVPSVGGTINMLTDPASTEARIRVKQEVGTFGFLKTTLAGSTGLINNKWAFSTQFTKKTVDGYADNLYADAYSYFGSFSYNFNAKNRVDLFLLGAPQQHGQRLNYLSAATLDADLAVALGMPAPTTGVRGTTFNPHWGTITPATGRDVNADLKTFFDGEARNPRYSDRILERENYYHKPQMNLNWYLRPSEKLFISNVFYGSKGIGGGSGRLGSTPNVITATGQLDWQTIYNNNIARVNSNPLYSNLGHESTTILRNSVNQHNWYGWIGKAEYDVTKNIKTSFGLDARHYTGQHWQEVRNLIGGDFYLDRCTLIPAAGGNGVGNLSCDYNNTNRVRYLGDKVAYNNDGIVDWFGGSAQVEAKYSKLSAVAAASLANTTYDRIDYFRPKNGTEYEHAYIDLDNDKVRDANEVMEKQKFPAFSAKGGVNYNLSSNLNVFANAGRFTRAPLFNAVYRNNNTIIRQADGSRLENEQTTGLELGVGFKKDNFKVNLNVYNTYWENRTISQSANSPINGNRYTYLISGVNQLHRGIELDGEYRPNKFIEVDFAGSTGNWVLKGTGTSRGVREDNPSATEEVLTLNLEGLYVDDAPMTTAYLGLTFKPVRGLSIKPVLLYFDKMYSKFDPQVRAIRADATPITTPTWRLPSYSLLELHTRYYLPWKIQGIQSILLGINGTNLLDKVYVSDGYNNSSTPNAANSTIYIGAPRSIRFSLRIEI